MPKVETFAKGRGVNHRGLIAPNVWVKGMKEQPYLALPLEP